MIVEIKQHTDQSAASVGLDKYNRSKIPGTFEILQPSKGYDGRWLTGIDENSLAINSMRDIAIRDKVKEETIALRKDLESLLNIDLGANNDAFWGTYKIILKDNFSLNFSNAQDKLKYYVLIANQYAAPELDAVNNPEYANTKYYVSRKEEEVRERVITAKVKDEARAKLLEISKNSNKFILIAKYLLGARRIKEGMNEGVIYEELSNFLNDTKEKSNLAKFIEATNKTVEDLQYKLTLDEAVRIGIIKVREGYYQRGNATYGRSLKEALDYLSSVGNSAEFSSLKDEVDNN